MKNCFAKVEKIVGWIYYPIFTVLFIVTDSSASLIYILDGFFRGCPNQVKSSFNFMKENIRYHFEDYLVDFIKSFVK